MPATQQVPPVSGVPARRRFYLRRCVVAHGRDERWRFHRLGIRTEVIAIIVLAAALPGWILADAAMKPEVLASAAPLWVGSSAVRWALISDFDQSVGTAARFLDRERHVVDRRAAGRASLVTAMVGVTVNDGAHLEAIDRLAQARAAQKRKNFQRLAFDGVDDGRIVQHHDGPLLAHRTHGILEPHRFAHGLGDEALDDTLPERSEHAAAETADETLHPDEGDVVYLVGVAIEQVHAGGLEDFLNVFDLAGLVIMISEHADDRDGASAQIVRKHLRLTR